MPKINLQRLIQTMMLFAFFSVMLAHGQTATHSCGEYYISPGTITVTNTFSYPTGTTLKQLSWYVYVPTGWTQTNVQGDGKPMLDGQGFIGFTEGNYTSPVVFTYDLIVPAGYTGPTNIVAYYTDNVTGGFGNIWNLVTPVSLDLNQNIAPSISGRYVLNAWRTSINGVNASNTISEAVLVGMASDPDGDTLSLASIALQGTKGGSLTRDEANHTLTYTPPAHTDAITETFSYEVSDGKGGVATGTLSVNVGYGGTLIRAF